MSENTAYDPNAPEDAPKSGGQYLSRKDLRVIIPGIVLFLFLLYPFYLWGKANSERSQCIRNIKSMYQAMEQYALDKDDRFPVAYYSLDGVKADPGETGHPRTWASDIAVYMNPRASFRCPSASADEVVLVDGTSGWNKGKPIELSYGMYAPYSGVLRSIVENPNSVVIIAETSNGGAGSTYNPKPIDPSDGFVIGWDNSNIQPDLNTKFVTRLAFKGTDKGVFDPKGEGRHDIGVHSVVATGAKMNLKPDNATVNLDRDQKMPTGTWALPLVRRR
ncbi:MAG: hypothetical protein ACOYON_02940 [Fimbriimonas sp.]